MVPTEDKLNYLWEMNEMWSDVTTLGKELKKIAMGLVMKWE